MGSGGLVPPEFRKRPGTGAPAEAEGRRPVPQTQEEISARWSELMNKRGQGELTEAEEREASDLEAQMRRLRAQDGMDQAA